MQKAMIQSQPRVANTTRPARMTRPRASFQLFGNRQQSVAVNASAAFNPPPVSQTKDRFLQSFKRPLPAIYSTVVNELLVQQHLHRFNKDYQYTEIMALGVVSVFEQILEGMPDSERTEVFAAFIKALEEDPAKYKSDAAKLENWAKAQAGNADNIKPDASGDEGQKDLARIAEQVSSGRFHYNKFFAIGIFRMLELAGVKDPKALGNLVSALGVPQERVNADLLTYKGILSKLNAAKELMKEFIEREKKNRAAREAEKAAKAAAQPTEA